jgi:NAD(P)-dependent dehydrogenase (short-subunit alcohol dehydrogenase family)
MDKPRSELPVALVSGAARRLGAHLARALAARGYGVFIHYRSSRAEALAVLESIRREAEDRALGVLQADIADSTEVAQMFSSLREMAGRLDLLINNVGQYERRSILEVTPEAWKEIIDVNLNGTFSMCHHALPLLKATRGHIINLGDAGLEHQLGDPDVTAYRVSKHGIRVLTRSLALALGPSGVRVNMVSPAHLANSVWQPEGIAKVTPLGRLGAPLDVARACEFLIDSPFVTGVDIDVAGGYRLGFNASMG